MMDCQIACIKAVVKGEKGKRFQLKQKQKARDFTTTFVNKLLAVLSFNCISQVLKAQSLKLQS